jgi:hypothetical protein
MISRHSRSGELGGCSPQNLRSDIISGRICEALRWADGFVPEGQHDSSQAQRASPKAKGPGGLSTGVSTLELSTPFVGGKSARPIFLAPAFTQPVAVIVPLEAPLNGANGTQAGSLCYINAVAASLQVHGDSSRDGSGRSLDSPEGQFSIGFQPVFRSHVERC